MLKRPALITGVLVILYTLLRFWMLTDSCLWFDEIFSVHAAEHSWNTVLPFIAADLIHPPLFYLLLKVWIYIGGEGIFWLRLFPLACSVLAIIPFLLICRELKLKALTTMVALGLFATNGALIKYAQEVRMYSLLLFLSLTSMWLFSRYLYKGKSFTSLIICNILLVHTHYFGGLFVVSQVILILFAQRVKTRQILLMGGVVLASFIPWSVAVYGAGTQGAEVGQNIGWIARPGFGAVMDLVFDLIEPLYFQAINIDASTQLFITVPLITSIVAFGVIYMAGFVAQIRGPEEQGSLQFLVGFIAVPIVLALAVSLFSPYSVWGSRHLIITFAPVAILIAIFLTEQPQPWLQRTALGVVTFLVAISLVHKVTTPPPDYVWCSWEKVASEIKSQDDRPAHGELPDPVYAFEDLSAYHLWFALRHNADFEVVRVDGIPGIEEDKAYFLPRRFDGVKRKSIDEVPKRFSWAAYRDVSFHSSHPPLSAFAERGFQFNKKRSFRSEGTETILVALH